MSFIQRDPTAGCLEKRCPQDVSLHASSQSLGIRGSEWFGVMAVSEVAYVIGGHNHFHLRQKQIC